MNDYDYKDLNAKDKEFVDGFKWCVEEVVDNFFNNLNDYSDSYLTHVLNEKVPEHLKESYEMDFSFGNRDTEHRQVETYSDMLRAQLLEWCTEEMEELIISILDGYEDEASDGQDKEDN